MALAIPYDSRAEIEDEQHLEFGETCIKTAEPRLCMEAYGFQCDRIGTPGKSVGAYVLGCNLTLSEGRKHFVQILQAHGGWNVELQKTYEPDPVYVSEGADDPGSALTTHIFEEMRGYMILGNGSLALKGFKEPQHFAIGLRKNEYREIRAICGVVLEGEPDKLLSEEVRTECGKQFLSSIKRFSQTSNSGPYRVAGASELIWQNRFIALASGDYAFVVEGRYAYPNEHMPCRFVGDCCSGDGSQYLKSCRAPTGIEMQAIRTCLSKELHSEAYFECLREKDVTVDCDENGDGSQTCY